MFGAAPFFHITGLIGHLTVAMLVGMPVVMGYRFDPDVALELIERHGGRSRSERSRRSSRC